MGHVPVFGGSAGTARAGNHGRGEAAKVMKAGSSNVPDNEGAKPSNNCPKHQSDLQEWRGQDGKSSADGQHVCREGEILPEGGSPIPGCQLEEVPLSQWPSAEETQEMAKV